MNSVDRVKAICKERHIPISKLERDLGFSNAYIAQLKKGTFPAERLLLIAEYLGVSQRFLLTGEDLPETKKAPSTQDDALLALFHQLNDEGREKALDYLDDMVSSGKYIQSHQNPVGKEA